jgi:plasmid stabilization system protein ParE
MRYTVRHTRQSEEDLNSIFDYIKNESFDRAIAEKFVSEIERRVATLADFPYLGKERGASGERRLVKKPYIIRYKVDEPSATIYVQHVLHSARKPSE